MDDHLKQIEACYDRVAPSYAAQFLDELAHKALDRDLLDRFAERNRDKGLLCDLGCGPGQVSVYLRQRGCKVIGIDLSARMVQEAAAHFPDITFLQGNMLDLKELESGSLAGITAFYAIVNLKEEELAQALAEMHRVLQPDGELLLSFHVGNHAVYVEQFLEQEAMIDFFFYEPDMILEKLEQQGFGRLDAVIRYPYADVEYPSKRAYIHAVKKQDI